MRLPNKLIGLVAAIPVALFAVSGNAETLKVDTATSFGLTTIIPQLMAKSLQDDDIQLQINSDQTLTRSSLSLGAGRIDATLVPTQVYEMMRTGTGPYAKSADQAKKAAEHIRGLFPFISGAYQPIVWADSGIENWDGMRGKRIFIGPPGGAVGPLMMEVLKTAGHLEADKDYEPVRGGFGGSEQSFQDGQFDVIFLAAPIGSASVEQLGLQRKVRIIGVPSDVIASGEYAAMLERTGLLYSVVKAGTYGDSVADYDKDIVVTSYSMVFSVNESMSDDLAYKLTKTYWENLDDYKKSVAALAFMPTDDKLLGNNSPLHPGATRYYEEIGLKVPDSMKIKQ